MAKKVVKAQDQQIEKIRHSLSHVLAQAVLEMFPEAKLGIGPTIENGFYYDFDLPRTLIPEDLKILEKKMKKIVSQNQTFLKKVEPVPEAIEFLQATEQPYKVELAQDLSEQGETELGFYENIRPVDNKVTFVDMCRGPHVESTKEINAKAFTLEKIAGAYWRGDEKRPMLQRIYGLAFETPEELAAHLVMLEEQKKRDHRKIGKELEIYTMDEDIGAGLVMWMPNGTVIRDELEKMAKEYEWRDGYQRVSTPHIAKEKLYLTSGHLPYYAESMFAPMDIDGEKYYLKSMNCPHHHKLFAARPRSYQELPVRFAEYGQCYRYEDSGALFGLMRVRGMCMNDAHIYVTPDQVREEFIKVMQLHEDYYKLLGIETIKYRLSLHSKEGLGKKYIDNEKLWIKTEDELRKAMKEAKMPFDEAVDEAAFYGPKIDVQIYSAIGREFTVGTNQLDFSVPEKFNLTYAGADGKDHTPLCIHRAPLSTHERFIGFLIEHFAGVFPLWLAPVQVEILPIAEDHSDYAREIHQLLRDNFIRAELSAADETLGKRIRKSELKKVPYTLVIGDKERDSKEVAIRSYKTKEQLSASINSFLKNIQEEIKNRAINPTY